MSAPRATEAAIRRAIAAWQNAGLSIGRMEVTPEGKIILTAQELDTNPIPKQTGGPKKWQNIG